MHLSRRHLLRTTAGLAALAVARQARSQPSPSAVAPAPPATGESLTARATDGLELSVRSYGDPANPEILFVHGLGQSRLSWDKQVASGLAARFRLVTFDLRGHGDSGKPNAVSAYSAGDLWAGDIRAVIEAAGLRRPVLVGWSLGGLVAGLYLHRYGADGIAGVNLVDAVTRLSPDLLGAASLRFAPLLASNDLSIRVAATTDFLAACFSIPPTEAEFRRMLVFNGMVPRELQEGVVRISAEGLDAAFAEPARMLVTYGGKDALTTLEMSRRVLDLNRQARLSLYERSGHSPFFEEPERFNRELAAFAAA